MLTKLYTFDDDCKYKIYDKVLVKSKSYGRSLESSIGRHHDLLTEPQLISSAYRETRTNEIVYVIKGDYFLERDLKRWSHLQLTFKW